MNEIKDNTQNLQQKLALLKDLLKEPGSAAIAFSGGVDSTFLLKAAKDVLGEHVIAITAVSSFFPERESREAIDFCREQGVRHIIVSIDTLSVAGVRENPPNRCYLCKKELFRQIIQIAAKQNISYVAEGSNLDDMGDYRPGLAAVAEWNVKSPLKEAGLTKDEIRILSKELALPTWEKPSFACLASRFVYGETITTEKLAMVEQAEQFLSETGFRQFRVRIHGDMARIELLPEEFGKLLAEDMRTKIVSRLKSLGFTYVSMDLAGYRTGSMNEFYSLSPYGNFLS